MAQIANYINSYSDNTAYSGDQSKDYPNVSYIQATDEVKWYKYDPEYVVCKYNVTSTESATKLLNGTSNITEQYIDGVLQNSVQANYTFSTTGEHIVKYKITSPIINQTFKNCTNLVSVTIPDTITTIQYSTFEGCTSLTDIVLSNLTLLGDTMFKGCTSLSKVVVPNVIRITLINNNTFQNCSSLTSFEIPQSVTQIKLQAFISSGLTSITIPSGVTTIGNQVFSNCSNLSSVTVLATTPPTLGSNVFNNTNNCPIYVPAASVNAYKTASGWSTYASRIQAIPTT